MKNILTFFLFLGLTRSVTPLKCWHCLPTGGEKLCNDGNGRSVSCSSGDSVCIQGTTFIDGERATVRSCLDGSKYVDGACMKNSSELSGIPAADFCICTNDLCNNANHMSSSNQIIYISMHFLILLKYYYWKI